MVLRLATIAAATAATSVLGGCYSNVVRAEGPAARNYEVHQANIGSDESVWASEGPRPVDAERYGSGTTLDRAKPIPAKKPKTSDGY